MTDFTQHLEDEVARLELELQRSPLYVKWEKAKNLLAAYKGDEISGGPSLSPMPPAPVARSASTRVTTASDLLRRPSSAKEQIVEAAREWIAGREAPTSTSAILAELQRRAIEVGGVEPRNTLSSILSRSEEFESHGRAGWTLVVTATDREKEKADDTNPTPGTSSALFENRTDHPVAPAAKGREAGPGGGT